MGTVGKILVDEHYPTVLDDDTPIFDKIESIRSNVKFEQCYERSKLIGDGKFGKVYLVREKATGTEFAAKVIRLKQQADRQEVEREVSILTQLRHPRIAQIYDAFYTANNEVVLVMEIVRGGELFDRVADENYVLTEQAVVMIICQLCEAIDYIHEQNILHLDIKPENIMCVSQTGNRIKLIDFGLARYYDGTQELRYMAGTPEFAAPEVIKYEQLDFSTDMWSVGVITYILLSGYSPFLGENVCETYCNVEKGEWEFTEEFDSVSEEAKDFVSRLIVYDKRKRMLPKECLAHPWIAKYRAKANIDTILEKPAEGPVMDKKQMMRYNAKRKFRRLITYVKIFIELSRLRRTANCRMSQSGQKFVETLLIAAQQEKQHAQQNVAKASTSDIVHLPKLPEKIPSEEKTKAEEASTSIESKDTKEDKKISVKRTSASKSPEKIKAAPSTTVKTVTPSNDTEPANETLKKKRSLKKADAEEHPAIKPPHPVSTAAVKVTTTTKPEIKSDKIESDKKPLEEKKMSIPEVIVTSPPKSTVRTRSPVPEKAKASPAVEAKRLPENGIDKIEAKSPLKKSASIERPTVPTEKVERRSLREKKHPLIESTAAAAVTNTAAPVTVEAIKKSTELKSREQSSERRKKEHHKTDNSSTPQTSGNSLPTQDGPLKKLGTENARESSSERAKKAPKAETENAQSLRPRRPSGPEAVITEPPKKTVLGTPQLTTVGENKTPMRMQRFGSSESGDSTKENRGVEEKKPMRQGAMRKKDKIVEDPLITSLLPPPEKTTLGPSVTKKRGSAEEVKPLLAKANLETNSTQTKSAEDSKEDKSVTRKRGSLVQEKLLKLNATVAKSETSAPTLKPSQKEMHAATVTEKKEQEKTQEQKTQEQKKGKLVPITTESKTTTTTLTSTSTKSKKASIEKKVQHISTGKKVEEVERKWTEQDNSVNLKKITSKQDSLDTPSTTTVKQNVTKQDSLRSIAEKERIEEETKDYAKTLKTARSALTKTVDKVTIEESSKANGKATKVSVAGTKDVTRKVNEKAEVDVGLQGKTLKKSEVVATEKVKTSLDIGKDGKKGSIEKTTVQKLVVNPTESSSKGGSKTTTSLRSRSSSPTIKHSNQESIKKKTKTNEEDLKKPMETKPPAPQKTTPKESAAMPKGARKESAAAPEKIPAIITKSTSVKLREEKRDGDEANMKKKRATVASSSALDTTLEFLPREDFSFDALKDKLIRRVTADQQQPPPKKECISITSVSSVRDRLRQFESKK